MTVLHDVSQIPITLTLSGYPISVVTNILDTNTWHRLITWITQLPLTSCNAIQHTIIKHYPPSKINAGLYLPHHHHLQPCPPTEVPVSLLPVKRHLHMSTKTQPCITRHIRSSYQIIMETQHHNNMDCSENYHFLWIDIQLWKLN